MGFWKNQYLLADEKDVFSLHVNEDYDEDQLPDILCLGCGNKDRSKFENIVYETMDGKEYDIECEQCGSLEVECG
jgi:hypothetical protein